MFTLMMASNSLDDNSIGDQIKSNEEMLRSLRLASCNYMMVDIGANLTDRRFAKDLDSVVQRSKEAGVKKIIVTGTSVQGSKAALRLTRLYPDYLYCTAGIHPHDAKTWTDQTEEQIYELAKNPECVAIGECGLDFNRNFSPQDVQLDVFEKQVKMACELKMPMFLHERDAHQQLVDILVKHQSLLPAVVIHCFTGTVSQAQKYIDLGFYIGLTGFLWKDKAEDGIKKVLQDKIIPLDRLLIETDSPYCYPNIKHKKLPEFVKNSMTERSLGFLNRYCTFQRNEPCALPVILEMVSAYLGVSAEEVALKTTYNAMKIFGLSS